MSYLLRFLIFTSDAASFRNVSYVVLRHDRKLLYVYGLFLTGKTSLEKVTACFCGEYMCRNSFYYFVVVVVVFVVVVVVFVVAVLGWGQRGRRRGR